jgi:hypothetical protein
MIQVEMRCKKKKEKKEKKEKKKTITYSLYQ